MKISSITIDNFKSIRHLKISDIDNTLILVGKNNTGKTVILDSIRVITGNYAVKAAEFFNSFKDIVIEAELELSEDDIMSFYKQGIISKSRNIDIWKRDFFNKLCVIATDDNYIVYLKCVVDIKGNMKYFDKSENINYMLKQILPKIYYIDYTRNSDDLHKDIFKFQGNTSLDDLRQKSCVLDRTRSCTNCFDCIADINSKPAGELSIHETAKLMEYKLYNLNLNGFSERVNYFMQKNGAFSHDIHYSLEYDIDDLINVKATVYNLMNQRSGSTETLGTGIKSIYILSLLEAYSEDESKNPSIIIIEEPEIFLHPQLQKTAGEIIYNLSKKNQVIFSTHAPSMVTNFSMKQIRQVILDEQHTTSVAENTQIDDILDDLGYTANDFMNVSFVFIVEGKQDSSRLPLLLKKYYSEIYDDKGALQRVSIIPTNSCTNIKTYANLKYMNQLYLKDQFLMIRDSDGKNPEMLRKQLCSYYYDRGRYDVNNLPRVMPENVLILKYYSFENYFLNPSIMAEIGVIPNTEYFYNVLYSKYRDYLSKLWGFKKIQDIRQTKIKNKEDIKSNMELIKTYVRGHNLFDIFYGRYKNDEETEILKKYIDVAPRKEFKDILDAIDNFIFFKTRKKNN